MTNLWRSFAKRAFRDYDFNRLVSLRIKDLDETTMSQKHIICDIDKTYLETKFETFYQLARVAFERASSKRIVKGASDVLIACRWSDAAFKFKQDATLSIRPHAVHFLSSSPTQLRKVLEEKLLIDGLDWSSDTFKNQTYNILKGRVDLLKHHVAYKSAAILELMNRGPENSEYILIGDNAEWDAYVYVGIQLLCAQKLSLDGYARYLETAGVDSITSQSLSASRAQHLSTKRVVGVLIRKAPKYPFVADPHLTERLVLFDHYLEAALALLRWRFVHESSFPGLLRAFHNRHGFSITDIAQTLESVDFDPSEDATLIQTIAHCKERFKISNVKAHQKLRLPSKFVIPAANLSEQDILELAKVWVERIRLSKNLRDKKKEGIPQ